MRSKVEVAGHALHPMLIAFPLGLLGISPLWDILRLATGHATWGAVAFWTILAGVVSALLAAVPGFIDWLSIPSGTRARRVGTWHMVTNLGVTALFALSLALRASAQGGYLAAGFAAMLPGWIGFVLALLGGWLGGELVETLGMSVREGANLNHPPPLGRDKERGEAVPLTRGPAPARS
jgi:uncharacterized membrane protein